MSTPEERKALKNAIVSLHAQNTSHFWISKTNSNYVQCKICRKFTELTNDLYLDALNIAHDLDCFLGQDIQILNKLRGE
jgi:hypothetical protein